MPNDVAETQPLDDPTVTFTEKLRHAITMLDHQRGALQLLKDSIAELEGRIYKLAVLELKIVTPPKDKYSRAMNQFRCAGKVVQITISDDVFKQARVQLYEIGSLPEC